MATFKICVFEHQRRRDNKYPVSIRVFWKGKCSYIGTEFYVTEKQTIKKSYFTETGKKKVLFALKDTFILNELNRRITEYENIKSRKLGFRIEMYTARELSKYFEKETKPGTDSSIDFIEFARKHVNKMREAGRTSTAGNQNRVVNSLIDFCNGRDSIAITEITSNFLVKFEEYLRKDRVMKRKNQFGKTVTTKRPGVGDTTVFNYMTDLRVMFNAALAEFNDEDMGEIRIQHYPFRKYKIKPRPENKKRNLAPEQIKAIRDAQEEDLVFDRAILARDVFMLSFYLVGINMADLYSIAEYGNGRISYERQKTKGRRQDRAYISIKVEPEAEILIEKYRDKTGKRILDFHNRYSTSHIFSSNVNKGLKKVAEVVGISEIPLSTYYARHSWATIARNKCDISKDDVDLALNHVDHGLKLADIYIEKDWTKVDRANRAVLDLIKRAKGQK